MWQEISPVPLYSLQFLCRAFIFPGYVYPWSVWPEHIFWFYLRKTRWPFSILENPIALFCFYYRFAINSQLIGLAFKYFVLILIAKMTAIVIFVSTVFGGYYGFDCVAPPPQCEIMTINALPLTIFLGMFIP